MTPTDEIAALRRVVEALHDVDAKMEKLRGRINSLPCNVSDALLDLGEAREMLDRIVGIARRALPAASLPDVGEGETVAVWEHDDGRIRLVRVGSIEDENLGDCWRRLGTVRLALIPAVEEPK
jgi:hypothetical protein